MIERMRIPDFSLRDTLECGQFFRYTKLDETYVVQSGDRIFSLRQKGEALYFEGIEREFLRRFLRLDDDVKSILETISKDPTVRKAIRRYRGMRLIRQDPWECLLSFLCSSAKSIPHIRCIIESLCRCAGIKIWFGPMVAYGFPRPQSIPDEAGLEEIKAGFRAPYLMKAGQCIDEEELLRLKAFPLAEARRRLMEIPGVGNKIADCVLLYSLDFLEAFPIDTWMRKGLQRAYFDGKRVSERRMEAFVSEHFGPYAGYAQLYLFHYWRHHPPQIR